MAMSMQRKAGCLLAGILFALAWFMFVDGCVLANENEGIVHQFQWYYVLPGLLGSLALIMMNSVSLNTNSDDFDDEETVTYATKIRFWFFLAFTISFCCVAGGVWIFVEQYRSNWIGVAILLNPLLILASAILLLIIRTASKSIEIEVI